MEVVLASVVRELDRCWWHIGGVGMRFGNVRDPKRLPPDPAKRRKRGTGRYSAAAFELGPYDPVDFERFMREMDAARGELERWMFEGVGMPGFFSRFAAAMAHDWNTYFASDARDLPSMTFSEAASRFNGVWFDPPPEDLPPDICLIVRSIDGGYLDLFFRDEPMFRAVWADLDARRMNPRPYERLNNESHTRRANPRRS